MRPKRLLVGDDIVVSRLREESFVTFVRVHQVCATAMLTYQRKNLNFSFRKLITGPLKFPTWYSKWYTVLHSPCGRSQKLAPLPPCMFMALARG